MTEAQSREEQLLAAANLVWRNQQESTAAVAGLLDLIAKHAAEDRSARAELEVRIEALRKLYSHLVKRVFDQFGIEITNEWKQAVIRGDHDVPLPQRVEL